MTQLPRSHSTIPPLTNDPTSQAVASYGGHKEAEPSTHEEVGTEEVEQVGQLPKEIERAGVTRTGEAAEIPPDLAQFGVQTATGGVGYQPVVKTQSQVVLPISDEQIYRGLHAQVSSSLKWLAYWCLRKLKQMHLLLKQVRGRIVRIKF